VSWVHDLIVDDTLAVLRGADEHAGVASFV
jgi:hypothetical protein